MPAAGEKTKSLKGLNYKKSRPLNKAQKLAARQRHFLPFNHPDLLEERRERAKRFGPDEEDGGGRQRRRRRPQEEVDDLFRDLEGIEGEEEIEDEEQEDEAVTGDEREDGEEEEMPSIDEESNQDEEELVEDNDDDDEAPPEEFSSSKNPTAIEKAQQKEAQTAEKEKRAARKKLSKKKRDSRKAVQKVDEGVYSVEMGSAKFQIVALSRTDGASESDDEGALSALPTTRAGRQPKLPFRDQLLRLTKKRDNKKCKQFSRYSKQK